MMQDADDTAKSLQTLYLLGRKNIGPESMISEFSNGECFKTYEAERNPSPSANCNVLKALLLSPNANDHAASIEKAVRFLCDVWFSGTLSDKWVSVWTVIFEIENVLTISRINRKSIP
jgi:hypothetical protein